MKRGACLLLGLATLACASPSAGHAPAEATAPPAEDARTALRAALAELEARPEHQAPSVTLQHCLIAVEGLVPGITRTPAEAEQRTAELYAMLRAGADFDALVKANTDDEHPGIYRLSLVPGDTPGVYPREAMVLAFGDVGWRLAVGEVGIARYDGERFDVEAKSPFGYHLIKRLE